MIGVVEACDDTNLVDGDGCSSVCVVEGAYFCEGFPSSCYPCLQYCLNCTDNSSCTACNSLTLWNSSSLSC